MQEGRFSRARTAANGDEFAGGDGDRHVDDCADGRRGRTIDFVEIGRADKRRLGRTPIKAVPSAWRRRRSLARPRANRLRSLRCDCRRSLRFRCRPERAGLRRLPSRRRPRLAHGRRGRRARRNREPAPKAGDRNGARDWERCRPSALGHDLERGRHAREEQSLRIRSRNDRRVGDDVLDGCGRLAHLDDASVKHSTRIGVDGELHALPRELCGKLGDGMRKAA